MFYLLIFLFSVLLLGTVYIGPFSIRVYATLLMTVILYLQRKLLFRHCNPWHSPFLKLYIAFLFVMGISLVLSGDLISYNFPKKILAYYFVCIICYTGIYAFVIEKKDIDKICQLLTAIFFCNSVITILQFSGISYGWQIGNLFEDLSNDQMFIDSHGGDALGYSRVPGIFGSTVSNAFMLAVLAPLSLYLSASAKDKLTSTLYLIPYVIGIIACFMTQQRAAFGLYIVSLIIILMNNFRKKPWLIFVFLLISCFFLGDVVSALLNIDYGRLLDNNNSNRATLTKKAENFILDNFFFGGPTRYSKIAGLDSAHNLLYDSWITAGLGGFILMSILYAKSLSLSIVNLYKSYIGKKANLYIALSFLISMIYGLVHNTSYLSGDCIILILLALLELSIYYNRPNFKAQM